MALKSTFLRCLQSSIIPLYKLKNKAKERIIFADTLFHNPVLTACHKIIVYTVLCHAARGGG